MIIGTVPSKILNKRPHLLRATDNICPTRDVDRLTQYAERQIRIYTRRLAELKIEREQILERAKELGIKL